MNKRFIAKWAKMLRSGKFEQTHGTLKSGKALCCIGVGYVACKGRRPRFSGTYSAAKAIGLTHNQQDALVNLNDSQRQPFAVIADYIEVSLSLKK